MPGSNPADPAARKLELEQPSFFFRLPIELRYWIYEEVFRYENAPSSVPLSLAPLGCCRQFYMEARETAFSLTDFHFDWRRLTSKHFDGAWYMDDGLSKIQVLRMNRENPRPGIDDGPPATRSPSDMTVRKLAMRSHVTAFQTGALRRLTIKDPWYTRVGMAASSCDMEWLVFHFLHDLRLILSRDYQLDVITIRPSQNNDSIPPVASGTKPDPQGLWTQWGPVLARLRDKMVTKRIILRAPNPRYEIVYHPRPNRFLYDRMCCTSEYFERMYARHDDSFLSIMDGSYAKQAENTVRWRWMHHVCETPQSDWKHGIEVYKEDVSPLGIV